MHTPDDRLPESQANDWYYDNPVIPGLHPDPSACRVGEDYYLVCSSFEYFPGVPIFHSRDLVHWRQLGNVLDRPSQLPLPPDAAASDGIYAPTIRHHDGRFWLITTNVSHGGNFIVTAERPEGPWSDPVWIDLPGIDPDLAWDEDGNCWCAFAGADGPAFHGVRIARVDPEAGKVLEGPFPAWAGTGLQWPEAPHLYRIGQWWYLVIAEGGTERGHTVAVARARSPRGPWEAAPNNPVLTHRSTNQPIQSTGHADLVTTPDGQWWMILLGTRPRGYSPGFHVLGRETFLTPVRWEDGWPHVGPVNLRERAPGPPRPLEVEPVRDDFDAPVLAPRWISPRSRPDDAWSLTERPGWLTLRATGSTLDRPGCTFVGRRQRHQDSRTAVLLDPGSGRAGLSVRMDEAHHYDLEVADGQVSVIARIGPLRQSTATRPVPPGPLVLTITTRPAAQRPPAEGEPSGLHVAAPDFIAFHVGDDPLPLAELDGRYLSTEVATGFTGRVIGMYVTEGTAWFDWFDHEPLDVPRGS
ncbi:glycoside hydrolase family 43 protein [Saccharothrix coeruleofusca]|uniref:Glycoside hydrolase 43 family protein n=1 Tax=Saccharothrix coeruleofusca TaxID=33919 RepID=A0A918AT00_9PSEU|nr:glycoside hydrolase family 43 protein [Saccharothrix coeruleofusca]GGP79929.1 glycoside hydrolase 43 family protein [Saccharothrix coeruleofusca]